VQSEVFSGGAVDGVAHVVKFTGIRLRWGFSPPPLFSHLITKSMLVSQKSKLASHSFLLSIVVFIVFIGLYFLKFILIVFFPISFLTI
jgi:hypothetical protein